MQASLCQTATWIAEDGPCMDPSAASGFGDEFESWMTTTDTAFGQLRHMSPVAQLRRTPGRWDLPTAPSRDPPAGLAAGRLPGLPDRPPATIPSNPPHRKGCHMIKEFKAFILKGNVVDLAVAVVIGAAFGGVVSALVKDLITPLLAIPGKTDFGSLHFTIRHSEFLYGDFLNVLISFVSVAAAVFFLVVKPVNALIARRARGQEEGRRPVDA